MNDKDRATIDKMVALQDFECSLIRTMNRGNVYTVRDGMYDSLMYVYDKGAHQWFGVDDVVSYNRQGTSINKTKNRVRPNADVQWVSLFLLTRIIMFDGYTEYCAARMRGDKWTT